MNGLSRVVLLSALILSGYSSASVASYFLYLKENGTTPITSTAVANLGDSGAGTLTVPANALGTGSPSLTFTIPGSSLQTSQVYMWKPGTEGQNECLDMGVNATGLSVSSLLDSTSQYSLTLTVVPNVNANCTDQSNTPPTRTASITGPAAFSWNGTYHLYNPLSQNSVPEPGSLALLGLGLSALVFVNRRKATKK